MERFGFEKVAPFQQTASLRVKGAPESADHAAVSDEPHR